MAKRILVIDDSEAIRQSILYVLEQEGYIVLCACDGEEGLKIISEDHVDLTIIEYSLPEMSGIDFLERLQKNVQTRMPVLILIPESHNEGLKEVKKARADGWVLKPFSADTLLGAVKKIIGSR